jgi:transposase InsO family protein
MKLRNPLITDKLRTFYYTNCWTHKEVQEYLEHHFCLPTSVRTLKYWKKKLEDPDWIHPTTPNPPIPGKVINPHDLTRILEFRRKTGYGAIIIKNVFNFSFSESTIKRTIKSNGLSRGSKIENKRIHWVKWQRKHPNSLWQMDGTKIDEGIWVLPIIDDCSRFCVGLAKFETMNTGIVTKFLEKLIKTHGKPREILTDNGTEFGGIWKNSSEFDKWCNDNKIIHIRSRIHKPTTAGKVERFHGTFKADMKYCKGDMELFRYRYNHIRTHRSLNMKTPAEVYFSTKILINGVDFEQTKW